MRISEKASKKLNEALVALNEDNDSLAAAYSALTLLIRHLDEAELESLVIALIALEQQRGLKQPV